MDKDTIQQMVDQSAVITQCAYMISKRCIINSIQGRSNYLIFVSAHQDNRTSSKFI